MTDEQIKALTSEQIQQLTLEQLEWLKSNKRHLLSGGQLMDCWFVESTLKADGVAGTIEHVSVEDIKPKKQPKRDPNTIYVYGHFEQPMGYVEQLYDSLH